MRDEEETARAAEQGGFALLRVGHFFEAHEYFERASNSATGTERVRLRALAQLCASYHQLSLGRAQAAVRTWTKACRKLAAIDALAVDYQRRVETFWRLLGASAEGPRRIPIDALPPPAEWPGPDYLRPAE
jgi:hypothetical protein